MPQGKYCQARIPLLFLHSLVIDGVYYEDSNKRICFQRLPPPADSEVAQVTAENVKKIHHLLERRGLGPQAESNRLYFG
jgi:hypothetical protein